MASSGKSGNARNVSGKRAFLLARKIRRTDTTNEKIPNVKCQIAFGCVKGKRSIVILLKNASNGESGSGPSDSVKMAFLRPQKIRHANTNSRKIANVEC